jgi:hypothetical protein
MEGKTDDVALLDVADELANCRDRARMMADAFEAFGASQGLDPAGCGPWSDFANELSERIDRQIAAVMGAVKAQA